MEILSEKLKDAEHVDLFHVEKENVEKVFKMLDKI